MRVYDLREYLFDLVSEYFQNAKVIWSDEVKKKPALPCVMLAFRNLTTSAFSSDESTEEEIVQYKPSRITLEVSTFTKMGASLHNDSLPDLNEFNKYIESTQIVDELFFNDLSITPSGGVQYAPNVLGVDHEYHVLAEYSVNFTQFISGLYGIKSDMEPRYDTKTKLWTVQEPVSEGEWTPTTTGGGSYAMESAGNFDISEAEITNIKEEQHGK